MTRTGGVIRTIVRDAKSVRYLHEQCHLLQQLYGASTASEATQPTAQSTIMCLMFKLWALACSGPTPRGAPPRLEPLSRDRDDEESCALPCRGLPLLRLDACSWHSCQCCGSDDARPAPPACARSVGLGGPAPDESCGQCWVGRHAKLACYVNNAIKSRQSLKSALHRQRWQQLNPT